MASKLNYEKATRQLKGRNGEPATWQRWNTRGWRTRYPQVFPVTRTVLVPAIGDGPMIPRRTGGHQHWRRRRAVR